MSGHSKWATIRHKKSAQDAKRGKIFSRLSKELTVSAKQSGGDPEMNPRLRTVIATAKAANMPSDNIERAIKKGTGELPGVTYDELSYEGYGPGGVAILIEVLTDNKNRTGAEVRTLFNRNNGNLATSGSVAWLFQRKGQFIFPSDQVEEETLMEVALESGAEDIQSDEENFIVTSSPEVYSDVADALTAAGLNPAEQELAWIPENTVLVEDEKIARQVLRLLEAIEDHDDVQNVSSNVDVPEEVLAALSEE